MTSKTLYDLLPISDNLFKNNDNILELKNPSTITISPGDSVQINFFDITNFNSQLIYLIQLKHNLISNLKILSDIFLTKQNTIDIISPYSINIIVNNISNEDFVLIQGDSIGYLYPLLLINIGIGKA